MLIADPNPFTPNRQSGSASQKTLTGLRQGFSVLVLMVLGHWLIKPLFQTATVTVSPNPVVEVAAAPQGISGTAGTASEQPATTKTIPLETGISSKTLFPRLASRSLGNRVQLSEVHTAPAALNYPVGLDTEVLTAEVETLLSTQELNGTLHGLDAQSIVLQTEWEAPRIRAVAKLARNPIRLALAGGVQTEDFSQINAFQLGFRAEKTLNTSLSLLSGLFWNRQFFGQLEYAGEAMFEVANPNLPGYAVRPSNQPAEYIRTGSFQVDLIQIPLELQYKSPRQLWKASAGVSMGLPLQIGYASGTTLQEKQLFDDRARQGLSEGIAKRFFTATLAVQIPVHEHLEMEVRGNLGLNDISNDAYMGIQDLHSNKGIQLGLVWKY